MTLESGVKSKKELVESIWGYDYDPVIHDPMIYTQMTRLRKFFGPFAHLIILTEEGYALDSSVEIFKNSPDLPETKELETFKVENLPSYSDLNYRQIQILSYLKENSFVDIQIYKQIFSVSNITASRDLSQLASKGFVQRVGKGRATKYCL